jgi:hypothetical protein
MAGKLVSLKAVLKAEYLAEPMAALKAEQKVETLDVLLAAVTVGQKDKQMVEKKAVE